MSRSARKPLDKFFDEFSEMTRAEREVTLAQLNAAHTMACAFENKKQKEKAEQPPPPNTT